MTRNSRIIWSEGMFLRPQHFQQHDRHLAFRELARSRALIGYDWGLTSLRVDESALAMGKFGLLEASGLLPDGTPFRIPSEEIAPAPIDISADTRDGMVYLCATISRPGLLESDVEAPQTSLPLRYTAAEVSVADSNARDSRTAQLTLGQLNLRLQLDGSDIEDAVARIGIARVTERRQDGTVVLDKHYIPPMLKASASPILQGFLRELVGLLAQRGAAIAARMGQPGGRSVSDVTDFLMLKTINEFEPQVRHLEKQSVLHPERLYVFLLSLAGALDSFRDTRRCNDFPAYDHDNLRVCFGAVIEDIRQSLSMVLEQNAIQIPLQDRQYGVRVGVINDANLIRTANFILAVNAQIPQDTLRARFPTQVKIGPVEKIRDLVNFHLPGVTISPMPVAPRALPYRSGFSYFELNAKGNELWAQLQSNNGAVALHVAGDFPGLELEFWAVRVMQ